MHVCMYLSIYLCMYVCMYVCTYVYVYTYVRVQVYVYVNVYVYVYMRPSSDLGCLFGGFNGTAPGPPRILEAHARCALAVPCMSN